MTKNKLPDNAKALVEQIVIALQEKKGNDIVSLDLKKIPGAVAKYFVICHGTSKIQSRAIFDFVIDDLKEKYNISPFHTEGYKNSEWLLIDFVDVVVHIFTEEIRYYYNLESLWADAKKIEYLPVIENL